MGLKLPPVPSTLKSRWHTTAFLFLTACALTLYIICGHQHHDVKRFEAQVCPQAPALNPLKHADFNAELDLYYQSRRFKRDVVTRLAGAVRIPTESYDDLLPVGQDPRWAIFGQLHEYLQIAFPNIYDNLNVTTVNRYGLVFHWQGANASLKPILFTAHQDVVPVDPTTLDQWIHPPYSGNYDGTFIWGRGSVDDKSDLVAQLTTINTLLSRGFRPTRSIVLAFGFDEESAGTQGAGKLAEYLEANYGLDGFSMLIDEGGGYWPLSDDVIISMPHTAEKGYLDVRIEVSTSGGHSSVPPKHTSIGVLSAIITEIESNPHPTRLQRDATAFQSIQCQIAYDPNVSDSLKKLARQALSSDPALDRLESHLLATNPLAPSLFGTTQAVDLIHGGVKVNALPENAWAVVNHRIADYSSVNELKHRIASIAKPVALKFNLSVDAFGSTIHNSDSNGGQIVISDAWNSALEPAPITPTGANDAPWQMLSGTIRATHATSWRWNASTIAVGPALALGNTDTQYYWNLTRHIFRYSHTTPGDVYGGIHTINEAVRADGVVEQIRFFTKLILNVDESTLL